MSGRPLTYCRSLNFRNANGGKNGYSIDIEVPGKEVLETFEDRGIEAPGIWNIPVCSMEEVQENYYNWATGWGGPGDDNPTSPVTTRCRGLSGV